MSERTVHFHFDYISPYAYVAWTQISELATRHNCELKPTPVLFAGLLNAQGNLGPAEIPAKRLYVFRNAQRLAQDFGLPFRCPPTHPFNPLLPLRISGAIEGPALQAKVINAFFDAVWGQGKAIDAPEAVRGVLSGVGLTAEELIQRASDPLIKARLNQHTSEAVARGAFGVPTVVVDDELFWGVDALPHLERYLRGEQQLDKTQMQRWHDVPATAGRKRKDLGKVSLMKDT
jgi:2-hydroxychromene-2-carboxylate isomerase